MAPNPLKPYPIELDRTRHLLFDFNALCRLEEATGQNALAGITLRSARDLRSILWCGLLHEDPELTIEDVGAMMHAGNATEITAIVGAAFRQAMPAANTETDQGNAPAVRSRRTPIPTGQNSGR